MKRTNSFLLALSASLIVMMGLISGCKKKAADVVFVTPLSAHFTNQTLGNYFITAPGVTYKVPIGITTVSDKDITVNVTVTSPTGAVLGTHYTLSGTSVTIKAGQTIDSITVTGVYAQYLAARKDTLVFTIQDGNAKAAPYNNVFKLYMRGPCSELEANSAVSVIGLNAVLGNYTKTNEDFGGSPYGPYLTKITAVNQLSPTTGTIAVQNIWDGSPQWNPITFTLDWTTPAAPTLTLVQQSGIGNAGTISTTYAGMDISVRPYAGQVGTYSYCTQTFTIKMQLGVTGLGWFSQLYTVVLKR